ncbi:MAG: DegV family protein, partial [Gallicola sp.]|nr:DegV family protein [Gallicola sp.]
MTIKIVLDSGSDIPSTWIDQEIMKIVPLTVIDSNKGIEYKDYYDLSKEELYKNMKEGTVYKTSQPSPESFYEVFKEEIEKGNIVLCLAMSSGISGTYQSAQIAYQKLKDENNEDNVHIFDTKGASGGVSLIAVQLQKYIDQGHSLEDVKKYAEFLIDNLNSLFCAEDLVYLYRGGRISKAAKIVTGVLDIKPAMRINKENGKLESYDKARGETKVY